MAVKDYNKLLKETGQWFKDNPQTIKDWGSALVSVLTSVQAEIIRFAMLLDKAGGTMTSAGMLLFGPGAALGNANSKKQFERLAQANIDFADRYEANNQRLEKLVSDEQKLLNKIQSGEVFKDGQLGKKGGGSSGNSPPASSRSKVDPWHAAEADDARERYRYEEKAWQEAEAADRVERRAYEQAAEAWRAAELADLREKMRYIDELAKKTYDASSFGGLMNGLDDYAQHATNIGDNIRESTNWAFLAMEDSLVNFVKTGKLSFSDLADSIVSDLIRIAIQSSITGPLASMFGSISWGSIFSSTPAKSSGYSADGKTFTFHDGGLVQRFHDGGLIPRYHFGGLAADEVPAILQTGERVLDREHNALLERFANKASTDAPTTIKIELIDQTNRGVSVEQSGMQFDGEAWAVRAVVKDFKSGGITRSLFSGGGNY